MAEDFEIFCYQDALGNARKGDPVELLRRLGAYLGGSANEGLKASRSPEPAISVPANERLALAVCKAFRLGEPWDDGKGEGVLEKHWRGVLDDFTEFLSKNGPRAVGRATSSPPTAPESSACPPSSSTSST